VQVVAYTDKEFSSTSAVLAAALALDDARTTLAYISYATGTGYPKNSSIKLSGAYGATIPLSSNTNVNVPYDDLVLTSVVPPEINDRFFNNICQTLLQGGVTPLIVVPGEQVAICRAVSTYTVNAQDLPDPTLADINTIRTIDYVTEEIVDNLSNNFQRVQLSPRILKSIVSNVAQTTYTLEANGILQNTTLYSANITAVPDTGTIGRVDVTVPVNVVVGLHVIAVNIQVNI
jgi:phage tail sheath gpL-like